MHKHHLFTSACALSFCLLWGAAAWAQDSRSPGALAANPPSGPEQPPRPPRNASAGTSASLAATMDALFEESDGRAVSKTMGSCDEGCAKCEQPSECGGSGEPDCCDPKKQKALAKAVSGAYKGLFYNNNFDYLCNPCYDDWHLGERFKRLCFGDCLSLDIGGQYRARYQNERNFRGLGLTGRDDSFLLHRTRLYANLEIGDRWRVYAEMIDAVSQYEDFQPRPIEENRADLLNLFFDGQILDLEEGKLYGRVGRQELLYGAQRLISPLDWANTRRTFEGAKLYWQGKDWDADAFWTQPVAPKANQFDSPIFSKQFGGLWLTPKNVQDQAIDLYYLWYTEDGSTGIPFTYNTCGGRSYGEYGNLLWELQGAYQFGRFDFQSHSAGFYTIGGGYKFACMPWTPRLWCYFDWASGATQTNNGNFGNGYDHLFPLAHKYLGFMDLFGRRNIEDWNVLLTLDPTDRLRLLCWFHTFHLQNRNDVPYNVNMQPFVTTAGGSPFLGQELDLFARYKLADRTYVLLGYSHFFTGDFYRTNPAAPESKDADFYYVQLTQDF